MRVKPILLVKPEGRSPVSLSLSEVTAIVLRSQGLAEDPWPFGLGKTAVLKAIQHLGYIQVDPINVLQRAHHHVLWSRVPDYHPDMLHELQDPEAAVFEYWNHAASYLPMTDYRFSMPLMRKYRGEFHWSDDSPELRKSMRRLLTMIRKQGPLRRPSPSTGDRRFTAPAGSCCSKHLSLTSGRPRIPAMSRTLI
jgi:uncharacterized protein YcaQ